jgi:hypothetical protein
MANEPALADAVIAPPGAVVNSARAQLRSYATNRRQLRTAIETLNRREPLFVPLPPVPLRPPRG